ncbi:3-succinoylsemialdehyde-pyridine dehydrogenase (plasmid) [Bradyrhizobium guangxiense]
MEQYRKFYIGGDWTDPVSSQTAQLIDPTTETAFATVGMGTAADVDRAVAAAREAFAEFSISPVAERIALFDRIQAAYAARQSDLADVIAREMGSPKSATVQTLGPIEHWKEAARVLREYPFERRIGNSIIRREAIGVCALISPWNWPVQTPVTKIAYALAAGCTIVFKPSEYSPLSAIVLAEILDAAGVPKGVFNLVNGDGAQVGEALCRHPEVDMISFTGSTRAGILVAAAAAGTVKRVAQELGGKSANVVLRDADLEAAARWNIARGFFNAGQSCHAPSRILVHRSQMDEISGHLAREAAKVRIGNPRAPDTMMGPVVNRTQFERIQRYIQTGLDEGARLVCGGPGRPEGVERGYFVRPTVFSEVTPTMTIAREEIFGPVLAVLPYDDDEEAVGIANGTPYGLGGYVFSSDREKGLAVSRRLRTGRIFFNGAAGTVAAPMGGYKQSGNGREMGVFGLEEYLEVKAMFGFEKEATTLPPF